MDATEHTDITSLDGLSESALHERDGDSDDEQGDQVGDEEANAAPLEAEEGEPPDVSETDGETHHGQNVSGSAHPSLSCGEALLSSSFVVLNLVGRCNLA